jgi:ribosomal-protein-alanine N-acetyltransferase
MNTELLSLEQVQVGQDRIRTPRLELVRATAAILRADMEGPDALGRALGATVPVPGWPPGEWDEGALNWMLDALESGRISAGWGSWYFVRAVDRVLVGAGGFTGNPDERGTAEIGYSVAEPFHRRGYATEAALGLTAYAFAHPAVTRVVAETLPHLEASLGVLRKLGFQRADDPSAPEVVRLARHR